VPKLLLDTTPSSIWALVLVAEYASIQLWRHSLYLNIFAEMFVYRQRKVLIMPDKVHAITGKNRVDPLAQHYGLPTLKISGTNSTYLGRIIIELYAITHPKEKRTDADNLRYTVGPANGLTENELIQRVAAAFPLHIANSKKPHAVIGPLANHKQPIIGEDHPDDRYLGRVVVELYETSSLQTVQADMDNLRYSSDPTNGLTERELVQRIVAAFPLRAKSHN